jgi:hypothetical protein
MAGVTLRIGADPADVKRAFGVTQQSARRANDAMAADGRRAAQAMRRTLQETQQAAVRAAQERIQTERRVQRVHEESARKAAELSKKAAEASTEAERKGFEERARLLRRASDDYARYERDRTRVATQENDRRNGLNGRDSRGRFTGGGGGGGGAGGGGGGGGRAFAGAVTGAVGAGVQIASQLHAQHQDVRQQNAADERALNTILLQTGANRGELAARRDQLRAFVTANHMNLSDTIGAMSEAQSRFNALGGNTRGDRDVAFQATLNDVEFAHTVDPSSMSGIPAFSAMLRQQGVSPEMRAQMVRAATGISFQGSVETDAALRQGLPGMLRSLSATLSTARPEQRESMTRDAVVDFLAQLQTVAASGGSVGVTGNRINNLRNALNNNDTQNRIGGALAHRLDVQGHRRMTAEERTAYEAQRAEFNQTFQRGRDGRYSLTEAVRNSPSQAAQLFGHMFNNDPMAVANFLGVRGAGGKRQLLNKPVVDLLTSYFAMGQDAHGRTVRQYEAVNDLRNADLSPERIEEMRAARHEEDQSRLNDDENNRRNGLSNESLGWFGRASNWLTSFQAENPVAATGLQVGGGAAATGMAGWLARTLATSGGGARLAGLAGRGGAAGLAFGGGLAIGGGLTAGIDALQGHRDEGVNILNAFTGRRGQGYFEELGNVFTGGPAARQGMDQSGTRELTRALDQLRAQLAAGQINVTMSPVGVQQQLSRDASGSGPQR